MIENKFYKKDYYRYASYINPIDDWGIWLLYNLLRDVAHPQWYKSLIEQLTFPKPGGLCGATLSNFWIEGQKVEIYDVFDDDENVLIVDREHLIELIKKWDELCKQEVEEIIIRRIDDRFEIEEVKKTT